MTFGCVFLFADIEIYVILRRKIHFHHKTRHPEHSEGSRNAKGRCHHYPTIRQITVYHSKAESIGQKPGTSAHLWQVRYDSPRYIGP